MTNRPSDLDAIENQKSKIESDDLWSRLRQSMERLAAAGNQKSDPVALAGRLEARAKRLRGRMTSDQSAEVPLVFLAFHKGPQRFGLPVSEVLEVQALEHFSPVPGTPSFILGVVHWRGAILSLLDLGKLFGIPELGIADVHTCVIVETAGHRIAVVAHVVEEILAVPRSELKSAPDLPGNISPEWVVGVHDDNRLILRTDQILQDARLVEWRK